MSRHIRWVLLIGLVGLLPLGSEGRAPAPQPFTLMVVPERVNLVMASMDIVDRRPVALVAYRTVSGSDELILHGWTDSEWVRISMQDYEGGYFLTHTPQRIILVEGTEPLPMDLVLASGWGPLVMSVEAARTDEFLNNVGQLFEFNRAEWRWFANRYQLEVEDRTPVSHRVSWYDQMSAARQQPARRVGDTPPVVPVLPAPEPLIDELDEAPAPVPVAAPMLEMDLEEEEVMDEPADLEEPDEMDGIK